MKTYPEEKGSLRIHECRMEYIMKRSKGESAFGIQGSRIFYLRIIKDGRTTGLYDKGWNPKIPSEDEESVLCLQHLINTFGKEKKKEKKQ